MVAPGADTPNVDFLMTPGFPIQGAVKNVRNPDGTFETYLHVRVDAQFDGTVPNDIDSITVTTPGGADLVFAPAVSYYRPDHGDFKMVVAGSPENGIYSFIVTGNGVTGSDTDYQYFIRTLPIPDVNATVLRQPARSHQKHRHSPGMQSTTTSIRPSHCFIALLSSTA